MLREALRRDPALASVVTVKTRAPRPDEEQGVHQIFLSEQEFDEWLARDAFLEHAEVYGHRSGVPRDQVRELLAAGKTVVIRTDVQGARTLRERVPQAVLIFLTAPDRETLRATIDALEDPIKEGWHNCVGKRGHYEGGRCGTRWC